MSSVHNNLYAAEKHLNSLLSHPKNKFEDRLFAAVGCLFRAVAEMAKYGEENQGVPDEPEPPSKNGVRYWFMAYTKFRTLATGEDYLDTTHANFVTAEHPITVIERWNSENPGQVFTFILNFFCEVDQKTAEENMPVDREV